ncbi:MAG: hypothetical protein FRX49_11221 [Trebouxia sp. A1-2]|nr:MAG: hypothetical protein FRX49_11221 [Trebouxia sp. A1-2]
MADITAAFSAAFRAQAEQMQGACMEFVKTNVDPPMKTDDEFIEFCAPFAKLTSERGISPDRFVEILFEVLHSLAQLNQQIERPTLIVCINVGVMKILNDTKDQPAALPGAEGVGKDKAAYNAALSDRDHVVDVLTAWLAAEEEHMQANKPNPSAGRADTEMDAPEDDFADDEMAAGEAAKNDEPVAAADAIDRMVGGLAGVGGWVRERVMVRPKLAPWDPKYGHFFGLRWESGESIQVHIIWDPGHVPKNVGGGWPVCQAGWGTTGHVGEGRQGVMRQGWLNMDSHDSKRASDDMHQVP